MYHAHKYTLKELIHRCENEGLGWKSAGVKYPLKNCLKDLLLWTPLMRKLFINGIRTNQIISVAEFIFPIIRPICIYKGNRYNKTYSK